MSKLPHTKLFDRHGLMTLSTLFYFYRKRLKVHAAQELLAGTGVAVAVALLFAVLVANGSITNSARAVVHAVIGPANLQLRARNLDGISETLVKRVEQLPGVKRAAPLLEVNGTLVTPDSHKATVTVAGTNLSLARMDGLIRTLPLEVLSPGGIGISRTVTTELHLPPHATEPPTTLTLKMRGQAIPVKASAVLGHESAGALADANVAVMPLARLQKLADLPARITRILVQSEPGRARTVEHELRRIAAGDLVVAPAAQDLSLLQHALQPSNQASDLFAGLSGLLGFLFAFNAILLTAPERRAAIADLRLEGATRAAIAQMTLFQGLCLGAAASFAGLVGGYFLATGLFRQASPGYLAQAFTLGTSTLVGFVPIFVAVAGGILATCLASLVPLQDLRRDKPADLAPGRRRTGDQAITVHRLLPTVVGGLLIAAAILLMLMPELALVSCALVACATVLAVPLMLSAALRISEFAVARDPRLTALPLALAAMKTTTVRSLALAATGGVALFGSIALGGARDDLLRALRTFAQTYSSEASVWVLNPHDTAAANDFIASDYAKQIAALPSVARVASYQSQFMVFGARRVWLIARPPSAGSELLRSQIVSGDADSAQFRLRHGGWVAVSKQIAEERHAHVGGPISISTPTGLIKFRLAATTTNLGWTSGVILMNTTDYDRFWRSSEPTALGVQIRSGASPVVVQRTITRELGTKSGLEAVTANVRAKRFDAIAGEGLGQLGEITTLLVAGAILAMAAALGSSLWQRRVSMAELRLEGASRGQVRRILLAESTLMLSAGCLTGALAGFYGQVVIDSYLRHVTGFPVAGAATGLRPIEIFLVVVAASLAIVAVPGWLASRVPAKLALND